MTADVTVVDSTLRDGSHALAHQFTEDQVRSIVRGLDAAGVPIIEISHGDGLGGSSFNYGFSGTDERQLVRAAAEEVENARLAVLLLPGIGVKEDLMDVREDGVAVARIATHCTEADISQQHIRLARDLGMEAIGFLMMAHMASAERLAEEARKMESYGAEAIYVVDSAGALTLDDMRRRVSALHDVLEGNVGVHAHNNLQLAVANSMAAYSEGATYIDGCSRGLGAGAGNCPTEVLVAVCEKTGVDAGVNLLEVVDVAEDRVAPIMLREQIVDRPGLLLGYAGVYSSFLLHAQRAAERFEVDVKDIILALGERQIVGGQEDMILDVAARLAGASQDEPQQAYA